MSYNLPAKISDGEINKLFSDTGAVLEKQMRALATSAYPYLYQNEKVDESQLLEGSALNYHFYKLVSCTVEKVDDIALYLQERMTKLFSAIHSLNSEIVYGIHSTGTATDLLIGIPKNDSKEIVASILKGLLQGIELKEVSPKIEKYSSKKPLAGIITGIPIVKLDDPQRFDISTIMRSLCGRDYTMFVRAVPCKKGDISNKYNMLVDARDKCVTVSKFNCSIQNSTSDNTTTTYGTSETRKGLLQEALTQIVRNGVKKEDKFSWRKIGESILDGGAFSSNISETRNSVLTNSQTTSFDLQNGVALELIEYLDKAISRFREAQNVGAWDMSISISASDDITYEVLKSSIGSELSKPAVDVFPIRIWDDIPLNNARIRFPKIQELTAPITSTELGMICTLPFDIVPDFELKEGKNYPLISSPKEKINIELGSISDGTEKIDEIANNRCQMPFGLSYDDLNKHTFVCGITGSGKTTTVKRILHAAQKPFWVIESAKKEYRNLSEQSLVYTLGKPEINCLQINPFYVQCGINLQTHIDYLKDLFNASFSFYGPMPYILEKCLGNVYKKKGWNLTFGYHPLLVNFEDSLNMFDSAALSRKFALRSHKYLYPTMLDLKNEIKRYIEEELQYDGEVGGNIKTAILARLESLCVGAKGFMFNTNEYFDMQKHMDENIVFELEGLADDSDKAFCVGLLVIFINEYLQVHKDTSSEKGLQHLLVIEEAHRLLKNTETERTSENMGNPKGKAVEHFTNMIAEMRSYGQGVIIAEQIPSKLAPDVIKNTSNKIVQRIVSADDQAIIANTIGIKTEEAVYLGNLRTGFALCHKEGMNLPVRVKINGVSNPSRNDSAIKNQSKEQPNEYAELNISIVRECVSKILPSISLKLLNSILIEPSEIVAKRIKATHDLIEREIKISGTSLIGAPSKTNKQGILGKVLFDGVISYLVNGIFRTKDLMANESIEELEKVLSHPLSEKIDSVKTLLKGMYDEECQNRGKYIICQLIAAELKPNTNVNIIESIKQYFFEGVSEETVLDIASKVKGGV